MRHNSVIFALSEASGNYPGPDLNTVDCVKQDSLTMLKILVVDDEATNIDLLELVLRKRGFEIIGASNALDGLVLAEVEQPDAIILDMMLPDLSGEDFCVRLRRNARIAHLPVVALTARTSPADKEKALAAGVNYYMTKPANFPSARGRRT